MSCLTDDAGVVLGMGDGGHGLDQGVEVRGTTDTVEVSAASQGGGGGDRVGGRLWPGVEFASASTAMTFGDYVESIGSAHLVVDMLVGALQRLLLYPNLGFTTRQAVPNSVIEAYARLCRAGFTKRLLEDNA